MAGGVLTRRDAGASATYSLGMAPIRVALAQIAPRLGALDDNLERHHQLIVEAHEQQSDLVVFPELGLTGYLLQDLNAEVAIRRNDPRLLELAQAAGDMSVIVSFVEESSDHQLFISAALLENQAVRHVHRKVFLPTYGLFDERRFFAPGSTIRAANSERLGLRLGLSICEDFWHLATPQLLALDGAQVLINVSSSPGRDVAAVNKLGLGTAESWRSLNRTFAQLTTSYVIFVNRVGVDESITFWGGSEVVGPDGDSVFRAPTHDEGLFVTQIEPAQLRRERIASPLLRDERPEVVIRQLDQIIGERVERNARSAKRP
jgi:NAD+ synthase (glutamine-hydrolysing)